MVEKESKDFESTCLYHAIIHYLFKEFYSSPVMKRIKATTRLTVGRVKP